MLIVVANLKLLGVEIIPFQVSVLVENKVCKVCMGGGTENKLRFFEKWTGVFTDPKKWLSGQ